MLTEYVPTAERTTRMFPLILTTGRILSQYNVGAQTRRTENSRWHSEDVLEIHPFDAEERGIADGDFVSIGSRMGATTLRAEISRTYAARRGLHHIPPSAIRGQCHHHGVFRLGDNCPEYKVTAVQVSRSNRSASDWQQEREQMDETHYRVLAAE